jgi:hypothetical protein
VQLACLEPVARELHITHWSSEDLARQAVADGIVDAIDGRAVRRILDAVDLQPHRTRYWRTARLDERFKERAERVLWCYGNAARLAEHGIWTVCTDEMPNLQVLEREPIRRAVPGLIERREFEYVRHGTVNLLNFLVVHSGRMETAVVERKDAAHYVRELRAFRRRHRRLRGVFLVHDGDPGHTAADTEAYLDGRRMVAAPPDAGERVVAEPGRVAEPGIRAALPAARIVAGARRVHRPRAGLGAGVQPALRSPVRVDVDQSEDEKLVRRT